MSYQSLFAFEQALANYTGSPYVVATDGCTHAIELACRYDSVTHCECTAFTYLSVPMKLKQLGINYKLTDEQWIGEYRLHGTRIWDSARLLRQGMYRTGQIQCLSFGNGKPLSLGRVGAILLDDLDAYRELSMMRSDGRDLSIVPWISQQVFKVGYHYTPTLEQCALGIEKLPLVDQTPKYVQYNDCRLVKII
jgi:dTDP-4-amino-4,6-dideoxygalactose transaminase